MYYDSVYKDTLFLGADSFLVNIFATDTSHTRIFLQGFCGRDMRLTALPGYQATVDTLVGDTTTTSAGQNNFCRLQDTLSGIISRDRLDSPTVLHINFQVASDTGLTVHVGTAKLKT